MKNKRLAVWLMVCFLGMLFANPCALADSSLGSKGEDVRQLQSMLIDLGFLEDKADGIFGRKTQAAVKAIQRYWHAEETGVADEGVVHDLEILWALAMGLDRESGAPMDDGEFPPSCSWEMDGETVHARFCYRHIGYYPIVLQLACENPPHKLEGLLAENGCQFWLDSIGAMYADWANRPEDLDAAAEQYEIFRAALEENTAIWNQHAASGSNEALLSRMGWLESIGVDLCFDLYGAEPNGL